MVDHYEIFKALLTVFFLEFVTAFLPDVLPYIDPASIEFMDKEMLKGVRGRKRRLADLVVKVRFKGQETYFVIHVENQAKAEPDFAKRMFLYFARLIEKFDLPVYPVAILSYDAPSRPEADRFEIVFPNKNVLQFSYDVIQLNRLSWKDFIKTPNPAAAALMTKMKIAPEDRTKVAGEILRMILTMKLDPNKADLIFSFMENYLQLTGEELSKYESKLNEPAIEEKKDMIKTPPYSSWGRRKYAEWAQVGKQELVSSIINRRFGAVAPQITERVSALSSEQLNELGLALLDLASAADLETWLTEKTRRKTRRAAVKTE